MESWRARPRSERTEPALRSAVRAYAAAYAMSEELVEDMADEAVRVARGKSWLWAEGN